MAQGLLGQARLFRLRDPELEPLEGAGRFLLALGALVAVLLIEDRGHGIAHGEVEVDVRGGGQGAEGLGGAGLLEAGQGGGHDLAEGLAVVFLPGTQANEEDSLGG
jgi:hypothetical protein